MAMKMTLAPHTRHHPRLACRHHRGSAIIAICTRDFKAGLSPACSADLARPLVLGSPIVCIREVQKTLAQSAKLLIENKIQEFGVGSQFRDAL